MAMDEGGWGSLPAVILVLCGLACAAVLVGLGRRPTGDGWHELLAERERLLEAVEEDVRLRGREFYKAFVAHADEGELALATRERDRGLTAAVRYMDDVAVIALRTPFGAASLGQMPQPSPPGDFAMFWGDAGDVARRALEIELLRDGVSDRA